MARTRPDVISAVERLQEWARAHELMVDAGFAVLIAAMALSEALGGDLPSDARDLDGGTIILIALGCTALVWRRSRPLTVLAAVSVVLTAYYVLGYGSFMSVAGVVAPFSVAAHARNRRVAWAAAIAYSVSVFTIASLSILDEPEGFNAANAMSMAGWLIGALIAGGIIRNRQRLFADSERRAEQAERDRVIEAERAVASERIRIAREMHDVVAHGMSVITVQAAAAQEVLTTDTEAASNALSQIESVGRESLNEMRRMLNVLRGSSSENSDFEPQPRIDDIFRLVERCVDAGLPTELTVTGTERNLPAGLGLAAYRIVQESLTNVVKHAGGNVCARVELDYTDHALEIRVRDDGRGAITSIGRHRSGNGLIGMRERVDVYAGEFEAGPVAGGGYSVRAALPIESASDRPAVASASDGNPTSMGAATA